MKVSVDARQEKAIHTMTGRLAAFDGAYTFRKRQASPIGLGLGKCKHGSNPTERGQGRKGQMRPADNGCTNEAECEHSIVS